MIKEDDEEIVPQESLPEWPLYVKHYEELEKAQSRIGKTPLKTMQWVTGLLALTEEKLAEMSKGDLENLSYELAVFSLLGTRRLPRIKAGKTIFSDQVWRGAQWGNKRPLDESIPNLNEIKTLLNELKVSVENILVHREATITVYETKFVVAMGRDRGHFFTFYGRIQDRFLLHLARLLADFGPRLQRCHADDCLRTFVSVRKQQLFCSTTCQSRIATRTLRQGKRKQAKRTSQQKQSDGKNMTFGKYDSSASKQGGSHGKTRR